MQLFREQRDAEIRNGERPEGEEATIEEWLQNAMLMTDMDKDDPEDRNKVTLMTVHSAKGLEYKYVYIVGLEENLFPSQRAAETPDGFEEERRLFYVALTRAKVAATLSYAEMRFKWGNMEFSRPSCFLREIDPRYIEMPVEEEECPVRSPAGGTRGSAAIDELRRRFDYRFRQQQGGPNRLGARPQPAFGRSDAPKQAPDPALIRPSRPSTEGMRRLGMRQEGALPAAAATAGSDYAVGQRVEHPKFGAGTVRRIEMLDTDQKLVVDFGSCGEKTLLAKFAKLTKL